MKNLKKKGKMLLCLMLALTTLAGLLVIGARQSWQNLELGALSQYYEIGSVDGTGDPGFVSNVPGDAGGISYGIYMFASNAGTPYDFAKWLKQSENQVYKDMGVLLVDAYEKNIYGQYSPGYGSNFKATWQNIGLTNKEAFYQSQKDYWQSKYYDVLVAWAKSEHGLDINNYSIALKNVFWSRSVHHGVSGAQGIINRAMSTLGGFKYQPEAELISAIYAECGRLATAEEVAEKNMNKTMSGSLAKKYGVDGKVLRYFYGSSGAVQESVFRRLYANEPNDALTMLYQNRSAAALFADGTYILKDNANQNRWLIANGTVSAEAEADNKMLLTWYDGGFYTVTCGGKRLTGSAEGASFADPAASSTQFWEIAAADNGGYVLKNRSTGLYLTIAAEGGTLGATDDVAAAARWQLSAQGDISVRGLIVPNENNKLTVGSSGFPVRGIVTSALPLTNVKVTVKTSGDLVAFQASSGTISANYYDLWNLDNACKYSSLSQGSYTLTATATVSGTNEVVTLTTSSFTVAPKPAGEVVKEVFTVTLNANGGICSVTSKTYELGEVYGELPKPTKSDGNFLGWFTADGTEITASTPVAANDHTITAQYGSLYTATFKPDNGGNDSVFHLAEGALIVAPANPVKSPDNQYSYSFSHWADASGNKFVSDATYMGKTSVVYTAVYTQSELPSQPTTPPDGTTQPPEQVDGGYLSGIALKTGVSTLTSSGYKVYDGDKEVTSGVVGTGMKAVVNNVAVTIVVTGDVSGDGKITITDVVKLQSSVVGKASLTGAYEKAADINGDGKLTITDVVQAAQYTVGKRTFN